LLVELMLPPPQAANSCDTHKARHV
jgi:hypothetical protein